MNNRVVEAQMMRKLYQIRGVTQKILWFRMAIRLAGLAGLVVSVVILERLGFKPQTWGLVLGGPVMVLTALFYHGRFKASLLISVCNKVEPKKRYLVKALIVRDYLVLQPNDFIFRYFESIPAGLKAEYLQKVKEIADAEIPDSFYNDL